LNPNQEQEDVNNFPCVGLQNEKLANNIEELKNIAFLLKEEKGKLKSEIKPTNQILSLRHQTLDWLSEVCNRMSLANKTFLTAANILDKICEKFQFELNSKDFHLISISALLLAIKTEEIKQISLDYAVEHLLNNKFVKKDLLSAEMLILRKLHFKLPRINFEDFAWCLLLILFPNQNEAEEKQILFKFIKLIFKVVCLHVRVFETFELSEIYFGIVFSAILISQKTNSDDFLTQFNFILMKLEASLANVNSISSIVINILANVDEKEFIAFEFKNFIGLDYK